MNIMLCIWGEGGQEEEPCATNDGRPPPTTTGPNQPTITVTTHVRVQIAAQNRPSQLEGAAFAKGMLEFKAPSLL